MPVNMEHSLACLSVRLFDCPSLFVDLPIYLPIHCALQNVCAFICTPGVHAPTINQSIYMLACVCACACMCSLFTSRAKQGACNARVDAQAVQQTLPGSEMSTDKTEPQDAEEASRGPTQTHLNLSSSERTRASTVRRRFVSDWSAMPLIRSVPALPPSPPLDRRRCGAWRRLRKRQVDSNRLCTTNKQTHKYTHARAHIHRAQMCTHLFSTRLSLTQ
jgi:hypothetical protein